MPKEIKRTPLMVTHKAQIHDWLAELEFGPRRKDDGQQRNTDVQAPLWTPRFQMCATRKDALRVVARRSGGLGTWLQLDHVSQDWYNFFTMVEESVGQILGQRSVVCPSAQQSCSFKLPSLFLGLPLNAMNAYCSRAFVNDSTWRKSTYVEAGDWVCPIIEMRYVWSNPQHWGVEWVITRMMTFPRAPPLEEKKETTVSPLACSICMDAVLEKICVPCGHFCMCTACSVQISASTRKCPMCRIHIESFKSVEQIENHTKIFFV